MSNTFSYLAAAGYSGVGPSTNFLTLGVASAISIIALVVTVICIVAYWKVFTKAGQPGWACIIPIYNTIVLLQIIRKPLWIIVLCLVPYVNFIVGIYLMYELAKAFGKGPGFTVGMVLLPFIFFPILGFGDAQYTAPADPAVAQPVV
jgi:hypothetical protein